MSTKPQTMLDLLALQSSTVHITLNFAVKLRAFETCDVAYGVRRAAIFVYLSLVSRELLNRLIYQKFYKLM